MPAFKFEEMDEERLYAALVRQSAYAEGVKNYNLSLFEKRADKYAEKIESSFKGLKRSSSLGDLSRRDFNSLLRRLDSLQVSTYDLLIQDAMTDLQDVLKYQRRSTQIIDASILDRIDMRTKQVPTVEEAQSRIRKEVRQTGRKGIYGNAIAHGGDDTKLWAKIREEINPASGLTIDDQFSQLSEQMRVRLQRMTRQGRANNWTVDELIEALTGNETPLGDASLMRHIRNSYNSTFPTVQQTVSQQTNAAINSAILPYFQWVSILDNATTEICQDRADRIYEYGRDPLPPAHYRCRSTVFPRSTTRGGRMDESESFGEWIDDQPPPIQDDLLTPPVAKRLRNGKIDSERKRRLEVLAKLYPQALEDKVGLML